MRRVLSTILTLVLAVGIFAPTNLQAQAQQEISVTIDGVAVDFEGQPPTIVDGRTLVPVRGVFEALGFTVSWEQATTTATLTSEDFAVIISVGSDTFTTNGEEFDLDVPAQIIKGRTLLPIRAVLESVGHDVDWDGATGTVLVTRPVQPTQQAQTQATNAYNFVLPPGIGPAQLAHNEEFFMWVRVQHLQGGFLNEIGSIVFPDGDTMSRGLQIIGTAAVLEEELGFSAAESVELMIVSLEHDRMYFLSSHSRIEIDGQDTFAIIHIPVWNSALNKVFSLFYMAQELTNGDIYTVTLFIALNDLDEAAYAMLDAYSAQVGYNFLSTATREMGMVLRVLEMVHGD